MKRTRGGHPVTRSGLIITPGVADKLADEFEQDFDLSEGEFVHIGRGRPSLDAGPSPQVSFRLSKKLREKAERVADAEGVSLSEFARHALEDSVEKHVA